MQIRRGEREADLIERLVGEGDEVVCCWLLVVGCGGLFVQRTAFNVQLRNARINDLLPFSAADEGEHETWVVFESFGCIENGVERMH